MVARRHALDAQGPLPDHARLHARGRRPGPGHDDPHLHGAGQPGLRRRSGHGEEVPRLAGVAAGGHGAVRRFAVHRRPAQRLPQLPLAHLDRHRSGPHRHARLRVRGRLRLRALRRLHARRADVLLLPRRGLRRRVRQVVPQVPARRAGRAAGHAADPARLVRSPDHRLPGSAAEEVPGDARRRQRAVGADLRAVGVLGRPAVRRCGAGRSLGPGARLHPGRAPCAARRRAPACAEAAVPRCQRARTGGGGAEDFGGRPAPPCRAQWRWQRRVALPRSVAGDRRKRPDRGRAQAGTVPR